MTFLEQLQAHKGGLIHLKSQLYWHEGNMWDNNPGRICLILDAAVHPRAIPAATTAATDATAAYFLIDGQTAWVWVAEEDIELLVNDQPIN
jgi:hypothetical protein